MGDLVHIKRYTRGRGRMISATIDVKDKAATGIVTVFDVASYILLQLGEISTMKLQKLVYYSQAWSLVWDEEPLFNEDFQAWANGPVCPELFDMHRGHYMIDASFFDSIGDIESLNEEQKDTIDSVLEFYGDKTGHWLSVLTHQERPWKVAREGYQDGDYCTEIIAKEEMQDYYGSLS